MLRKNILIVAIKHMHPNKIILEELIKNRFYEDIFYLLDEI